MRVLVTGAAGFLGGHVAAAALKRGWKVTATYRQSKKLPAGLEGCFMDLQDEESIREAVAAAKPQAVIHAAAMARPDDCAAAPQLCQAINVEGTQILASAAQDAGAKMVFVSTDLVYDGKAAPYQETTAVTRPLGVYGKSKVDAEEACMAETQASACLARTVLMYGTPVSGGVSLLQALIRSLRQGETVKAFSDQIRCPIAVTDLAEALLRCAERDIKGAIHLAGPESLSRLAFALKAAKAFKLDPAKILPDLHAKRSFPDPRPLDVSLEIKRMRKLLDMEPMDPDAGLALAASNEKR